MYEWTRCKNNKTLWGVLELNTFDRVKMIIKETLGCEEEDITLETNLFDDLGADSLDIIEMAVVIEEEFGLEMTNEEVNRLQTINSVVEYVERHE